MQGLQRNVIGNGVLLCKGGGQEGENRLTAKATRIALGTAVSRS